MLPYNCCYLLLLLLALMYKREKVFVYFYFLVFTVFFSFAINVGPDWYAYYVYFRNLSEINHIWEIPVMLPDDQARFEWGFHILSFILTRGGLNYHLAVACFNTISFVVYLKVFEKLFSEDKLIFFTVFIYLYGNKLFISTLRQNLAVCFFYLCLLCFIEKEKRWIIYFVLSMLFHSSSALVVIPLITYRFLTRKRFIIVAFGLFAMSLVGIQLGYYLPALIMKIFSSFIPNAIKRIIKLLMYGIPESRDKLAMLQFLCVMGMTFFIDKEDGETKYAKIMYVLALMFVVFKFHFTNIPMFSARLKYNFSLAYIYLVYLFICKYKSSYYVRLVPLLYIISFGVARFYNVKESYVCYVPYENLIVQSIKQDNPENYFDKAKFKAHVLTIGRIDKLYTLK